MLLFAVWSYSEVDLSLIEVSEYHSSIPSRYLDQWDPTPNVFYLLSLPSYRSHIFELGLRLDSPNLRQFFSYVGIPFPMDQGT